MPETDAFLHSCKQSERDYGGRTIYFAWRLNQPVPKTDAFAHSCKQGLRERDNKMNISLEDRARRCQQNWRVFHSCEQKGNGLWRPNHVFCRETEPAGAKSWCISAQLQIRFKGAWSKSEIFHWGTELENPTTLTRFFTVANEAKGIMPTRVSSGTDRLCHGDKVHMHMHTAIEYLLI